jgi:deoxycytidine triphosphate deaminase
MLLVSPRRFVKSTLLKTVRCFFIGHVSKCEAQFEGMCLSISETRHNYRPLKLSCPHHVTYE